MSTSTPRPERVTLTGLVASTPEGRDALDAARREGDAAEYATLTDDERAMSSPMYLNGVRVGVVFFQSDVERIVAARERALREEIARLTRWKEEALPVLDGLQDLGKALGLPLGERITGPAALAAAKRLTARGETR